MLQQNRLFETARFSPSTVRIVSPPFRGQVAGQEATRTASQFELEMGVLVNEDRHERRCGSRKD